MRGGGAAKAGKGPDEGGAIGSQFREVVRCPLVGVAKTAENDPANGEGWGRRGGPGENGRARLPRRKSLDRR